MRAHEVPTHVQAEDKALLFLTFPQVAALLAVFGMAYGVWRFTPFGPSELRLGLAAVVALMGIAATVGQIGGRRLPLAAADLLKYRLMPRRYEGLASELVRAAAPPPVERPPSRMAMAARGLKRRALALRRARRQKRLTKKERRHMKNERGDKRTFRPHMWFGKRRRHAVQEGKAGKGRHAILAIALLAALAAGLVFAQSTSAEGPPEPEEEWPWLRDVEFRPPEPVPGRRLFVEGLTVREGRAELTLRAATDLHLRVRAYGGPEGRSYLFFGVAHLDEGETIDYSLPLTGDSPLVALSWVDSLDQAGTVTLKGEQLPYPLPSAEGRLCDLTVESITWVPGTLSGVVGSTCVASVEEPFETATATGHHSQTVKALLETNVTEIAGTVTVSAGDAHASAELVPNGETAFSVEIAEGQAIHRVAVGASLTASIEAETPPVVELTHHEEWVEERTGSVTVTRPGVGRWVSETVRIEHEGGTITEHEISAYLSVPSREVTRRFTYEVLHEERVTAEVGESGTATATLSEEYALMLTIGSDEPYQALAIPEREEPEKAEQRPLTPDEFDDLFGWEYPLWR